MPRHLFVPYYYVGSADGRGQDRLWRDSPDPYTRERWLRGVYTDGPLATRLRDGELLSSSSQPSLMARMLAELRVTDGDHVLEIGAGTGYNAALLAHRLGDDHVTTVDLDPEITDSARAHLADAGHHPAVITGDGARGAPNTPPTTASSPPAPCPRSPGLAPQCTPAPASWPPRHRPDHPHGPRRDPRGGQLP